MYKYLISAIALAFSAGMAFAEAMIEITQVQQRFPWNGIVDVEYNLSGLEQDMSYKVVFRFEMTSSRTDVCIWTNGVDVAEGQHVIEWDAADAKNFGPDYVSKGSLTATLIAMPKFDVDTGVAFQPGEYYIWDLVNKKIDVVFANDCAGFNSAEYKTGKMVFRKVPRGSFYMQGTTNDNGSDPGHPVAVTKVYGIAIFETTVAQYDYAAGGSGSSNVKPKVGANYNNLRGNSSVYDWPLVKQVASDSIVAIMSQSLPSGYSLDIPTEVQWERAAKAGTRTQYYWGSSSSGISSYAWYGVNASRVMDVGGLKPNAWGLYDCCGNVVEVLSDWYSDSREYGYDPESPESGAMRSARGGSYHNSDVYVTINYRDSRTADVGGDAFGFRLVLNP